MTFFVSFLPDLIRHPALHLGGTAATLPCCAGSLTALPFGPLLFPVILMAFQRGAPIDVMRAAEVVEVDVDPQPLLCEVLAA